MTDTSPSGPIQSFPLEIWEQILSYLPLHEHWNLTNPGQCWSTRRIGLIHRVLTQIRDLSSRLGIRDFTDTEASILRSLSRQSQIFRVQEISLEKFESSESNSRKASADAQRSHNVLNFRLVNLEPFQVHFPDYWRASILGKPLYAGPQFDELKLSAESSSFDLHPSAEPLSEPFPFNSNPSLTTESLGFCLYLAALDPEDHIKLLIKEDLPKILYLRVQYGNQCFVLTVHKHRILGCKGPRVVPGYILVKSEGSK